MPASRRSLGAWLLLAGGAVGCSAELGGHAPRVPSGGGTPRARFASPARLFPVAPPSRAATHTLDDGTQGWLIGRWRARRRGDGGVELAPQGFPRDGAFQARRLPARLGGGWLFSARTDRVQRVWRAPTWLGPLTPLVSFDVPVGALEPGFDRLYGIETDTGSVVAIDAETGAGATLDALPATPTVDALAFADEWFGAVHSPLQGTLLSFDAGASWHPLDTTDRLVGVAGGALVFAPRSGPGRLLQPDGRWTPLEPPTRARGAAPSPATPAPLSQSPLELAALRGVLESGDSALVAAEGLVARVRLHDGALTSARRAALSPTERCQGLALGRGLGFSCSTASGPTTLHAVSERLELTPVLRFPEPRYVAASGNGAVVVRGPCATPLARAPRRWCVLTPSGARRELEVSGDAGVERVVGLQDGRVAVLLPPRLGATGQLLLLGLDGQLAARPLQLPADAEAGARDAASRGLWLDGFTEREPGVLAGWLTKDGPLLGVRVTLDGKLSFGRVEGSIERAFVSGPFALVQQGAGAGAQTTDGGFTWSRAELEPLRGAGTFVARGAEQGCSAVGCAWGGWARIGWSRSGDDPALPEAELPPPYAPPSGQVSSRRWQLRCAPTGAGSGLAPGARPATAREDTAVDPWPSFFGLAPPSTPPGARPLSASSALHSAHGLVRAYLWDAPGAPTARWQLRGLDPFDALEPAWTTRAGPAPWSDRESLELVFRDRASRFGSSWSVATEPGGRGAALLVTTPAGPVLTLLREGHAPSVVRALGGATLTALSSAVLVRDQWYLGEARGDLYRVFRSDGTALEVLASLWLGDGAARLAPRLVRSRRGDALGLFVQSPRARGAARSWYLYPLSLDEGRLTTPMTLLPEALGATPRACEPDADGWLVTAAPPVEPSVELQGDMTSVRTRRVTARLIVSAGRSCLDALSAVAEGPLPASAARASGAPGLGATLVLSSESAPTTRLQLRCVDRTSDR